MSHPSRRTVSACITFGDLSVDLEADGVYSPDGVHDLVGQVIRGFNEAIAYLRAHGYAELSTEDDDDDE